MVTTSTSTSTSTSGRQRLLAIFAAAVVIIGALGLTLTSVDAASSVTPRSGPSGKTVHGTYQGKSQKVPTMLFQVDLNSAPSFMFCIDIGTAIEFGVPYAETGWEESNVKNLAKVARVLSQTNATTTLDPVEIAAAQAAIWHFSDGFDLATNDARNDAAVIARYQALVDDAERNPVSSEPAGTLSVTPAKGSAAYGSPIFYDVATTSTDPIAIELSDSLVNAHPVVDGVCDIATTINTVTGASRFCVTAAGPRSNVKVTLRTAAAPLSAGRVFVRPNRQKLIIGKPGIAQANQTVAASWTDNGRPTVDIACPTDGVSYGQPATWTANASDPDGDAITYQWTVNGQPVEGATEATFTHTPQPGEQIGVIVTDSVGQSASADANCVAKSAPTVILYCPTDLVLGQENTFLAEGSDPDGDSLTYEWTVNGAVVAGNDTAMLKTVVNAGDRVAVTAIDSGGSRSDEVVASCIPIIGNQPPTVTLECPADAAPGPVTFEAKGSDPEGDELTYTWYLNGTVVAGETGPSATIEVKVGDVVAVEASDGRLTSTRVEVDCITSPENTPPTVTLTCPAAVFYGEPTIFVAVGNDAEGDALTYRWSLNGTVDEQQTGSQATFVLQAGDSVSVQARDEANDMTSDEVTVDCVGANRPTVTITCPVPTIYGEPATFIANGNDPDGEGTLIYTWSHNGAPIDGNLTPRLVISLQPGDTLTVTVTTEDGIVSAAASADCTGNTRPTVSLECPEDLVFGQPVTFTAKGADVEDDANDTALTYEWTVNGKVVEGETGPSAKLTLERGDQVGVRTIDSAGLESTVATSTCTGTSKPTVTLSCPDQIVFGEPTVLNATGTDADGDSLTFEWTVNGKVVEGQTGASLSIVLQPDDVVSVTATDPTGLTSDSVKLDCLDDVGVVRATIALSCPATVKAGDPVKISATVTGLPKGAKPVFTWAINGKVITGESGAELSVVMGPNDVVSANVIADGVIGSATVQTNCTTIVNEPSPTPIPSTPTVMAKLTANAEQRAAADKLAWTGSNTMTLVWGGVIAIGIGGLFVVLRRRGAGAA